MFSNGSGASICDDAHLHFDDANDRLGVGVNNPSYALEVEHADISNITTNQPTVQVDSKTLTLNSGATISRVSAVEISGDTVNGVAGGATETISGQLATLYVGTPTKSNITLTDQVAWDIYAGGRIAAASGLFAAVPGAAANTFTTGTNFVGSTNFGGSVEVLTMTEGTAGSSTADPANAAWRLSDILTTNASATTIDSFGLTASRTYGIDAWCTGRRTGGSAGTADDGAFYYRAAAFKTVGGTVTQIGATAAVVTIESQAGFDCTITNNSVAVQVKVTGTTNNNISWTCLTKVSWIGS